METFTFEQKLEGYAELAVKVGLNLQPGQRLLIVANPLEVAPLVRSVATCAYQNGSRLVTVLWGDETLEKIRYQHAPRDSFEEYPAWLMEGRLRSIEQGDAFLYIVSGDPELLKDQDPGLIELASRTFLQHYKPILDHQGKNSVQWSVISPPTLSWATKVFPDHSPQEAEARLWEAVFKACHLDAPDPVALWQAQINSLGKRKDYLTAKQYTALHFTGPGTDLTVGLPQGHLWFGGATHTPAAIPFVPNLPTEEVFTMPHKDKAEGTVTATRPLHYAGNLIQDFQLTFSEGKVVSYSAQKGENTLRTILETDENARRLGEVALVPHGSPIAQSGLVFLHILYDENAANHLALGSAYRFTLKGGEGMSDEEFAAAGGNDSLTHVDFMFGSSEMNVDGLGTDGTAEPVMRAGGWAFDL